MSSAPALRHLFAALAAGWLAAQAFAAADGPRLPCGVPPSPAYAGPDAPPNVQSWSSKAARGWVPPACVDSPPMEPDVMVAVAGSFRFDGDLVALCARIGSISSREGMRYWSTSEKAWHPLVIEAYALAGPDPAQRRPDFGPEQFVKGESLYFAQRDNRTTGVSVYRERVLVADRERLVVSSENITPLRKMMVTLFEPGSVRTVYFIERGAPGIWTFYSLTRTRTASSLLPTGSDVSYINRSVAFYRYVAGIPTNREPPPAR